MKRELIALFVTMICFITVNAQIPNGDMNGMVPVAPGPPPSGSGSDLGMEAVVNLTGASGTVSVNQSTGMSMITEYRINVGAGGRVAVTFSFEGSRNNFQRIIVDVFETDVAFTQKVSAAGKMFYQQGQDELQFNSHTNNGKLIVRLRKPMSMNMGGDDIWALTMNYSTNMQPLNVFSENADVLIGAHTEIPNLTIYDPVNKNMGSSSSNTTIYENANVLIKSGSSYKMGLSGNRISANSGLSITSESTMNFNSSGYYYFSAPGSPTYYPFKIFKRGAIGINNPSSMDGLINGKINGNQWEQYVNLKDASGNYRLNLHNGGSNIGSSYFACMTGRTIDVGPALTLVADHRGTTTGDRGILVLDGRLGDKSAMSNQVVVEFCSGWGNRLGHITGDGSLFMKGTIKAKEIKVTAQTADFVFENDYQLRSLEEVNSFISTNKHLPEIPSATQMEADGVNLAEMNKLLLQKIEELTLYTIEQNQQIEEKAEQLRAQEERLVKIEILLQKMLNNSKESPLAN